MSDACDKMRNDKDLLQIILLVSFTWFFWLCYNFLSIFMSLNLDISCIGENS